MKLRSALLLALFGVAACSLGGSTVSLGGGQPLNGAAGTTSSSAGGSAGPAGGGLNLDDAGVDVPCSAGKKTTLSGTVYDPAGKNALYNAVVYIPKTSGVALPPFPMTTVSCERCTDSVSAKSVALSGANGRFVLDNVPAGTVDLVVQLGKWRRKTTVRGIVPCQDNPIADSELTRLPRNQREGDIPKIALSTGHSDALECLLRKIGIDDAEFTTDAGNGRVNLFVGCVGDDPKDGTAARFGANKFIPSLGGQSFPSTNQLFDSGRLKTYDMVIFSCEGHKCDSIQTPANTQQLVEYADAGGRVFLDHNHYNWLNHANAPIERAATFNANTAPSPLVTQIYTSVQAQANGVKEGFPKGDAFAQWLLEVHASPKLGELTIYGAKNSCSSIAPGLAQPWIQVPGFPVPGQDANFYFTISTPVAVADNTPPPPACGRVVFTDLHVVSAAGDPKDRSDQDIPFPLACITSDLSPQEKALEFMVFDLSSCVQKETDVPTPPPPK